MLDPALEKFPAPDAAERCPDLLQDFLVRIGLTCTLRDFGIAKDELTSLAKRSTALPHYKNNPKVPTTDEILQLIAASY